MGSVGFLGCGEFNIDILIRPGRSCKFFKIEVWNANCEILKRSNYRGSPDDLQEVGLTSSSDETSNDRGAKWLA